MVISVTVGRWLGWQRGTVESSSFQDLQVHWNLAIFHSPALRLVCSIQRVSSALAVAVWTEQAWWMECTDYPGIILE